MPLEKLVKDIMRPLSDYPSIGEHERVERALTLMGGAIREKKPPHLIVVGNGGSEKKVIKGFVTPPEIVFGMADHFLKGAKSIGPIFWEGQLKSECTKAFRKYVREIMAPIQTCINGTEKLMEAIFLLNKYQVGFLPVVRCDEVTGIIHLDDILKVIVGMAAASPEGSFKG
jgi:CBS domain-containing protein